MLKSTSARRAELRSKRTNVVRPSDVEQKISDSARGKFVIVVLCVEDRPLL
jgi:hypothetical protein